MKYNLIINGSLEALTTSGTGNTSLTWLQLESLMDGNTTSSGVTLTTSGILYLEADLSNRIKVDGIRLYASDLTKLSNIDFYYKNKTSDSYTACSKNVGSYYYATIPDPSAPRYVMVTVSGIDVELYEFQIFNDDYIVAFGEDGSLYAKYLENTPIGETGSPEVVPIFNNSTDVMPADAYVCIDWTTTSGDYYIKISASENGTYYGIEDGAILEDNKDSSTYKWDMGEYDDTKIDSGKIIIDHFNVDYQLGEIPLVTKTNSFNTAENCWDWDPTNKKMYAIGSDSIIKLWEYKYKINEWDYIGEVKLGCTGHSKKATMCYMDDKIYCLTDGNQTFGYYDLSGSQDNWTTLSGHPVAETGTNPRRNIVSDKNRYIYCVDYQRFSITTRLYRYDTVSGTWGALDSGYSLGSSDCYASRCCICYDVDRDYIYLNIGNRGYNWYIQRYIVSSDSWNTTYLDLTDLGFTSANTSSMAMAYYNDDIWIMNYCETNTIKRYNVEEAQLYSYTHSQMDIDYQTCIFSNHMIAIDNFENELSPSHIFIGGIDNNREYLYKFTGSWDSGVYTSPVFKLDNKYNASYFITEGTTESGVNSISYNENIYNGTIRVRSSDTEPLRIDEIYWFYRTGVQTTISKHIIYNDTSENEWHIYSASEYWHPGSTAADRRTGEIAISAEYYKFSASGRIIKIDKYGNILYSSADDKPDYRWNVNIEFDKFGGLWGYGSEFNHLIHIDVDLNLDLYDLYDGADFLHDLAAEMDGDGVWYTNKIDNMVIHLETDGTVLQTMSLSEPRAICGTLDNGCWVIDNVDEKAYRYNSSGALIKTVDIERTATRMCTDMVDGFWYINSNHVYHVTSGGVEDIDVEVIQPTKIRGGYNGCIVWSENQDYVKYIDNNGNIVRTFTDPSGVNNTKFPALLSFRYEDSVEFKDTTNLIPISYDPVWGTGGSLEWKEVRKDGYFLPKTKYHQAEITLRTTEASSPYLNKLIVSPAIKVQDIQPQSSKNMYIKTIIPDGADITDYETKLKTWWGVNA